MSYDVINEPGFELHASQENFIVTVSGVMMSLATLSVTLRFFSRKVTHVPLLWDDWLILVALFFTIVTASINIRGAVKDHYGTHLLATATNDSLHSFLIGLYIFEITYTLAIGISKLSIIALYWRIFPSQTLKIPLIMTAALTVGWTIGVSLAGVFSCIPISAFWLFENTSAKCINSQAYFVVCAAINIFTDLILLTLPLYMVSRLQINFSQKVAVSAIFLLGIFGTICATLRLYELNFVYSVGIRRDPTWDLVSSGTWSTIESCVVVVCACLPSMRPLMRLILNGKFASMRRSSGRAPVYGASHSGNRPGVSGARHSGRFSTGFRNWGKMNNARVEERELQPSGAGTWTSGEVGLVPGAQGFAGQGVVEEVWVTREVLVEHSRAYVGDVEGGRMAGQGHGDSGDTSWMDLKGNRSSEEEDESVGGSWQRVQLR